MATQPKDPAQVAQLDAITQRQATSPPHHLALKPLVVQLAALLWRWGGDPRVLAALIGRYGAHCGLLAVAVLIGVLGHNTLPLMESTARESLMLPAAAEPAADPTAAAPEPLVADPRTPLKVITRAANPITTIPDRERLEVITYTVQTGDTVFDIALKFDLDPTTIVWSNMEILLGAPWLIQPGLTLYIPPVDGAYHTVTADQTPESIAEAYDVEVAALYNVWNDVEPGEPLAEGLLLIIPHGTGEAFEWEPPRRATAASSGDWGYLANPDTSSVAARGWFILPTGSYYVSGYVFGGRHGGLDYGCRMNDLIYAADAGVVDWVGPNGNYGNLVRITHGNGYQTYYAHLNAFAVGLGDYVVQGQVIGYCGTTGLSTGTHLHYEIRLNGVPQNPKLYEP